MPSTFRSRAWNRWVLLEHLKLPQSGCSCCLTYSLQPFLWPALDHAPPALHYTWHRSLLTSLSGWPHHCRAALHSATVPLALECHPPSGPQPPPALLLLLLVPRTDAPAAMHCAPPPGQSFNLARRRRGGRDSCIHVPAYLAVTPPLTGKPQKSVDN